MTVDKRYSLSREELLKLVTDSLHQLLDHLYWMDGDKFRQFYIDGGLTDPEYAKTDSYVKEKHDLFHRNKVGWLNQFGDEHLSRLIVDATSDFNLNSFMIDVLKMRLERDLEIAKRAEDAESDRREIAERRFGTES